MFEADYEPSTWDNEDGQRRHLAEGDPKAAVGKKAKPAAPVKSVVKAPAPKATVKKPVATMTNDRAALIE
jgi:hypothetical protein